ncbi:hypothetical protein N4T20_03745 [Flavobacterium sp. TR2]|uniref:hypothetical protein n=1 Tax=Flavobacterium sp. TR2 TaxID=2977321 RepID=UPI0021B1478C|nr:hypothetical protein [Flavobacterium sp. TR2]UWY29042.1 hypothetical protein N4T20_03745 [Flavobacterium sp. TR2]
MLFSATVFIPKKPRFFNLSRSEKLSYFSLGTAMLYGLSMLFIEHFFDYRFSSYFYYPLAILFLFHAATLFLRLTEFENLNGHFDGTIAFSEDFLAINGIEYKYSELENLVIYGNSFSGEKTKNYRYGPMYGNGVENLISFTHKGIKIERHFQLNSERHLDELQNTLIHIITEEKIPFKKEYLNFINEEHRSYILFEFLIGKLIREKKIDCKEGFNLIKFNSNEESKEFKIKYCP